MINYYIKIFIPQAHDEWYKETPRQLPRQLASAISEKSFA